MRRLIIAATLGLALFSTGACAETVEPADTTSPSASADNTAKLCGDLEKLFKDGSATMPFGVAVGELLLARSTNNAAGVTAAETKAKAELDKIAGQLTAIGADATAPATKKAFDDASTAVLAGKDLKFTEGVTDVAGMQAAMTPLITGWLAPLEATCS
jgi:hypothetical protein